jgi:hypothetical protein
VIEVEINSAISEVESRSRDLAIKECAKLAPHSRNSERSFEETFGASTPIVNSLGEIVAYQCGTPKGDPRLGNLSRGEWTRQRQQQLLLAGHGTVKLGARRSNPVCWLPILSVMVAEVIVDKELIEAQLAKAVATSGRGWQAPQLPANHYRPGGWERIILDARIEHPDYQWDEWYMEDEITRLATLGGYSENEVRAALCQSEAPRPARVDRTREDGAIISDQPDEYWQEMDGIGKLCLAEERRNHPLPRGISAAYAKLVKAGVCAPEGVK